MLTLIGCTLWATALFSQERPDLNNKLSAAAAVVVAVEGSDVRITPNPVQGQTFSIELQNLQKGKYSIYLYDESGKRYLVKVMNFDGGSLVQSLPLPKNVDEGVYILQVVSKTARFSKKMIIE